METSPSLRVSTAKGFLTYVSSPTLEIKDEAGFEEGEEEDGENLQDSHMIHRYLAALSKRMKIDQKKNLKDFCIFDWLGDSQQAFLSTSVTNTNEITLGDILKGTEPYLLDAFFSFLDTQFAQEILQFLIDITFLRFTLRQNTHTIYSKYLRDDSPAAINLTGEAVQTIYGWCKNIECWRDGSGSGGQIPDDMWTTAINEALVILDQELMPKFIASPSYATYKEQKAAGTLAKALLTASTSSVGPISCVGGHRKQKRKEATSPKKKSSLRSIIG